MLDLDRWTEIWATITRNKTRSLLTCLGVFWGILMLVLLLGAGKGLRNGIMGNFQGFATNSVFIWSDRTSMPFRGFTKGRSWSIRNRDYEAIRKEVKGIEAISSMLGADSPAKNIVYGQVSGSFNVKGVMPSYFQIESPEVLYGRLLNDLDERERRKVCLLGERVNRTLFKGADPCGKYVRVNGLYYQVAGVIKTRSQSVSINGRTDEAVLLPFNTMQEAMNLGDIVFLLGISVRQGYPVQRVIDDVSALLKRQNSIAPADPQAVGYVNLAAQFALIEKLFLGIDFLVWLVGMGTLLAGVIGISNIMMVTVAERTRELGIRRALGAKPFNIVSQVVEESLLLTALAGFLGLSLGVFLLDFINRLLTTHTAGGDLSFFTNPGVSLGTALTAAAIILLAGFVAGLIPAWRAMQIKAIDAIREE
ncbi:MAG: ABC transporter permease [Tannerella sp.]|nr:ABC transporter permease [Tannerella sp.]